MSGVLRVNFSSLRGLGALGLLWLVSPSAVFLVGAALALASLACARLIPDDPRPGREWIFSPPLAAETERAPA